MTAKDLLHLVLEYETHWKSSSGPPAKARREQIDFLLTVFGFTRPDPFVARDEGGGRPVAPAAAATPDLNYLLSGKFTWRRPKALFDGLQQKVAADLKPLFEGHSPFFFEVDMDTLFSELLQLRLDLHAIATKRYVTLNGYRAAMHYVSYLKHDLFTALEAPVGRIDDTLWTLLDPERRDIDVQALGYPEYDLDRMEFEWDAEGL